MSYRVDNAIIMAAGVSSRFAPLSYEMPKALIPVRGEPLLERELCQLKDAGIGRIILVTGYMAERFSYLEKKFGVTIVPNPQYAVRNNHSSIYAAREFLGNSYICSADNYFTSNPFESVVEDSYYAAVYADGPTNEWCMREGPDGYVSSVSIGGQNAWYMLGHVFWNEEFSSRFLKILAAEYDLPETKDRLWEAIYMRHLDELKLRIRRYAQSFIFEFDTLDELRTFDPSYCGNTRSSILKGIAKELGCTEAELKEIRVVKSADGIGAAGFTFQCNGESFEYNYLRKEWKKSDG